MQEEAMTTLVEEFEKVDALRKEGRLPEDDSKLGIHLFPRMAYLGHKVLHSYYQPLEDRKFRCAACMYDWTGAKDDFAQFCPKCNEKNDVYHLNHDHTSVWQCIACKYEWLSEKGWECPSCGTIKDAPIFTCKTCGTKWIREELDEHFCPVCHLDAWQDDK